MEIPCIDSNFIDEWEKKYYKQDNDASNDEADYQAIMTLVKQELNQSHMISLTALHKILDWKAVRRKNLKRFVTKEFWGRTDFYEHAYMPRFDIVINNKIQQDLYLSLLILDAKDFHHEYADLQQGTIAGLSKVQGRAKGFRIPVASTVLHFLDPQKFPIMDVRTREMLYLADEMESMAGDDPVEYEQFRSAMLRIQNTTGCNLHKIDRALWYFHKRELNKEMGQIYRKVSLQYNPDLLPEEISREPPTDADVEFRRLLIDIIKWEAKNATSVVGTEQSESPESKPIEPLNADDNSENSPSGDEIVFRDGKEVEMGLPEIIVHSNNAADELILAHVRPQERKVTPNTTFDIAVTDQHEFTKLPMNRFPPTAVKVPGATQKDPGRAVTLVCGHHNGQHRCEASFHRYPKGDFYIGSARSRLGGGQSWTVQYRSFLATHGLRSLSATGQPKQVLLKFESGRVDGA